MASCVKSCNRGSIHTRTCIHVAGGWDVIVGGGGVEGTLADMV